MGRATAHIDAKKKLPVRCTTAISSLDVQSWIQSGRIHTFIKTRPQPFSSCASGQECDQRMNASRDLIGAFLITTLSWRSCRGAADALRQEAEEPPGTSEDGELTAGQGTPVGLHIHSRLTSEKSFIQALHDFF